MRARTLSGQMLAWVIATLAAVWFAFVTVGYFTGAEEAVDLTDGHLVSASALILGDQTSAAAHVTEYQQSISVVVWDADGRVLEHRGRAALPAFHGREGFETLALGMPPVSWRSFSRWSTEGPRRKITVLIDADLRDELAWDIAGDVGEPGLWLLPVAVLVLGLVVRRGLAPLRELSEEVHRLDVRQPAPLKTRPQQDELRAVANAIDTLSARYQVALRREMEFAGELAHELRTPLTSIALQTHALRSPLTETEREAALRRLERDALRAGAVLTELLTLARASRAEMAEAAQALELAELARRVTAEFAQTALDSGHELSVAGDTEFPLEGHPVLLELALRNLVENALAHTGRGTRVEVQLDAAGGWLQVCDDGARNEGQVGARALGLGLGHRVVEKVAAIHDASFAAAAPPPGFTTCYRISLPRPAARPSPASP